MAQNYQSGDRYTRGLARKSTRVLVFIYLASAAGLLANLLGGGESGSSSGFIIAWLTLYAVSLPLIAYNFVADFVSRRIYPVDLIAFITSFFILISFSWSEMPAQSFRYSFSLIMNIYFAWFCARRIDVSEFARILLAVLNCMIVIGLLLGVVGFRNAIYIDPDTRSNILGTALIQGLFSHKIYAGYYSAVALTLNIVILRGSRRWFFSFLAVVSVAASGSSIGFMAVIACVIGLVVLPMLRARSLRVIALCIGVPLFAIGATFFTAMLELTTSSLGRDMTFTGRTEIWEYAIQFWSQSPFVGWGYGGIFGDAANAPGRIVMVNGYYQAPHFHDVYLQVAAELGTIGLLLYLTIISTALIKTLNQAWRRTNKVYTAMATVLIVGYAIGVGMNIGFRYNELTTIIIFFLMFARSKSQADDFPREFPRQTLDSPRGQVYE